MKEKEILKRDNSQYSDIRGVPMFWCNGCKRRFQTKGIAENHKCREK